MILIKSLLCPHSEEESSEWVFVFKFYICVLDRFISYCDGNDWLLSNGNLLGINFSHLMKLSKLLLLPPSEEET